MHALCLVFSFSTVSVNVGLSVFIVCSLHVLDVCTRGNKDFVFVFVFVCWHWLMTNWIITTLSMMFGVLGIWWEIFFISTTEILHLDWPYLYGDGVLVSFVVTALSKNCFCGQFLWRYQRSVGTVFVSSFFGGNSAQWELFLRAVYFDGDSAQWELFFCARCIMWLLGLYSWIMLHQLISPWTKWLPPRRRYFQMYFRAWRVLYFDEKFTEVWSWESNWQ